MNGLTGGSTSVAAPACALPAGRGRTAPGTVLRVSDLTVHYRSRRGPVHAVTGVSFELRPGETYGLVGESGCGKTTLVNALLRLLPDAAQIAGGEAILRGEDLLSLPERRLREMRWKHISLIPQSAMNSLDPVYRVGDQLTEVLRAHGRVTREQARTRVADLFGLVGLDQRRALDFPHQFSGGMRQRAVIAMALALSPDVVVADEPTTSLDVIVQAQILGHLREIQNARDGAMIIVSHDISVIAGICDRIGVMYAGQLVEEGATERILNQAEHPYTMGLRNAFPALDLDDEKDLLAIPGTPPDLVSPPSGCRFRPRCPFALRVCAEAAPPALSRPDASRVSCHRADEAGQLRRLAARQETWLVRGEE